MFGRRGWGCFSFSHVEFEVLAGYSGGEVKIRVGGAAFVWLGPCGARELWVECNISAGI